MILNKLKFVWHDLNIASERLFGKQNERFVKAPCVAWWRMAGAGWLVDVGKSGA